MGEMLAQVMIEMRSQLDDEMDLYKDELLVITDSADKMYFRGHSMDGMRSGLIPKRFVHIVDHNYRPPIDNIDENSILMANTTSNNGVHYSESPPSYENALNSRYALPACVVSADSSSLPPSLGYCNALVGDVQSYGRTLYDFHAEHPGELNLRDNEIVHLIRHIDHDWIEGEIDGRIGIFPKSFIEIIVDCDTNNILTSSDNNVCDSIDDSIGQLFPADTFARVLYNFDGEIETDLRVRKGDTLTLIRMADTNWVEAVDDEGNVGLIARNYIELMDEISSIRSINSSRNEFSFDETLHDFQPVLSNNENHIYLNDTYINDNQTPVITTPVMTTPVMTLSDIKPVITENEVKHFDTTENGNNINNKMSDESTLEPTLSALTPRRAAPAVPQVLDSQMGSETGLTLRSTNMFAQRPHRPPPPVPKHKKKLRSSNDSLDTVYLNRHESVRSSITSNSSSDTTSEVVTNHTTTQDQRRVDDRKKKVREQRGCVITELLQTERDYRMNLEVCANIFLTDTEEAVKHGIDLGRLFGNLEEVILVSNVLIQKLEESTLMKKYEHQMIGKCFLEIVDQMKVAYSLYCENHDQLQPLWIRYQGQSEAKQYLQRGLDVMREKTNCFDIPSVLIKPVQRILKYPLLLNELHKCTEDGHEDKPDLILAIDRIADMATHINEFKRRQDLVYKYRTESSHKLTSRLSKLNLHTVIKKGSRLGHRISSTLGLSNVTKDDEFNGVMQKFRAVEKTIKIFAKDKEAFTKSVEDFSKQGLTAVEAIAEYYDKRNKQQEVDQLRTTHRVIVQQYWQQFDSSVNTDVTPVLDKLMVKFSGPNKLIAKRFDKLTDYDSSSKKLECNKDTTRQRGLQEQQQLAKHVYEALNTQLIEELPQLCALSLQILDDCIQAFLLARKRLIGRIAKHHLALLELPLVLGFANGSSADITETFHIKHNLITEKLLAEISILSTETFPNVTTSLGFHASQSDLRRQSTRSSRRSSQLTNVNVSVAKTVGVNTNTNKNVNQSASQRMYLQARYQSHQLYVATAAYEAIDVLDIYLNRGDLVGVVKRQDPMGNSHRWYVDTGSAQGFVLSNILIVYHDDSWVTPPNAPEMSARPQTLYESPEKRPLCFSENQKSLQSQYNSSPLNDSSNSGSSLAQHQYKVHPTPDPPVHLRHDIETHRYEEVNDSPPRYSRLDIPNSRDNSLLSFDESVDEKQRFQRKLDHSFDEFDPLYASNDPQLATTIASTDHRYEEVPEERMSPPPAPQRQLLSDNNLHFAAYPFKAVDTNQMSLEFGQPVTVLKDRDLNGNTQWWFVSDREGRTGYVPSNYLQKYQTK